LLLARLGERYCWCWFKWGLPAVVANDHTLSSSFLFPTPRVLW
jgi:hypothetical protein